jgi:outer membrane protein assembly factor BamD
MKNQNIIFQKPLILRFLTFVVFISLTACSTLKKSEEEFSEYEYYQKAQNEMAKDNFQEASRLLKKLESRYPFGDYTEQAQLELIYTHFKMGDQEGAIITSQKFITSHPFHEQIDYAYYLQALSTYDLGFGFFERRFPTEQALRDQTALKNAYNGFYFLINTFPDSQYNQDAYKRILFIRERMAKHELAAVKFYIKRHAYVAAANRAHNIILQYPNTHSTKEALSLQTEAYKLLNQETHFQHSFAILKDNFPNHSQINKDGTFKLSGQHLKDRKTLFGVLSFGLID